MFPIQTFLCGWYLYTSALAVLMALSAGRRTWLGRVALGAAVVSLVLMVALYRPLPSAAAGTIVLGAKWLLLAVGLIGLWRAPRQDTKLIGLLLAAAACAPLYFHYAM